MEDKNINENIENTEKKFNWRVIAHIILILLVVLLFTYIGVRLYRWNKGKLDNTDVSVNHEEFDIEVMDYILPMDPKLLADHEDDGVTTILCVGNNPFSDEWWSDTNLTKLIKDELGGNTEVYNCSVSDSLVASVNETYYDQHPYDAFGFYWVCAALATNDYSNMDSAYDHLGYESPEIKAAIDTFKSLDMSKVDVLAIMYNGHDHFCNRPLKNLEETSIQFYAGALEEGIKVIQNNYPYIRIMVMSPTYEYGVDDNGNYIEADLDKNDFASLPAYVIAESDTCYENSVSFIDNFYGTVNQKNAKEYLEDNKKLNEAGRRLVAKRFVECFNMYNKD